MKTPSIYRTQKTGTSKERQECQPIHAFTPDKMPTFNLRRRSGNGESLPIHVPSSSSSSSPSKDFKLLHQQSKRMYSRNATTTLSSSSSSQVICGSFFITTVLVCILLFFPSGSTIIQTSIILSE